MHHPDALSQGDARRWPARHCSASATSKSSSPSPIVLITVLYFSAVAIFQALVERFAFLDYANGLQDVGYLFGLNYDCLALCVASPSNGSQLVLGKPFTNVALSETCRPRCQEQCSNQANVSAHFSSSLRVFARRILRWQDGAISRTVAVT
jgi:hypothetical protein